MFGGQAGVKRKLWQNFWPVFALRTHLFEIKRLSSLEPSTLWAPPLAPPATRLIGKGFRVLFSAKIEKKSKSPVTAMTTIGQDGGRGPAKQENLKGGGEGGERGQEAGTPA
jgi:hypothetical protein